MKEKHERSLKKMKSVDSVSNCMHAATIANDKLYFSCILMFLFDLYVSNGRNFLE